MSFSISRRFFNRAPEFIYVATLRFVGGGREGGKEVRQWRGPSSSVSHYKDASRGGPF